MKKEEYLKLALSNKLYESKAWIISAFSLTKEDADVYKKEPYFLKIIRQEWGYSFIDDKMELVKIDDSDSKEPLFRFNDRLIIDNTWINSCVNKIETSIGTLLVNFICLYSAFGAKFPYTAGKLSVRDLEVKIASKLQDTPLKEEDRSNLYFYVDEYLKFSDAMQFISGLSQLTTWSATKKTMTAPTGIREFKKELANKYGDSLKDPVEFAKYEKELLDFDAKYLEGDPSNGTFIKGKVKNMARKKMYLTLGAEQEFESNLTINPVLNSLEQGWPTDKKQYTSMMNILRHGSFSRGAETVKGGVSAKTLLRAANNYVIKDTDCLSSLGIRRTFNDENKNQLIGRYIIVGSKTILVDETNISSLINKQLIVRSPMYCKLPGDTLCKTCAGEKLFKFPTGLTIPLTEISAIILASSMAAMHGKALATAKLDIKKVLS